MNNTTLNEDCIGQIYCSHRTLLQKLDKRKPDYFELDFDPHRIIKLQNESIIISGNLVDNRLALYDSQFNFIKHGQDFIKNPIHASGLTIDKYGNVYVGNALLNSLIKLDKHLKVVKSIKHSENQVFGDICAYEDKIYSCIPFLKRIDVLSLDLVPLSSHYLEHEPCQIRVSRNTACIHVCIENDNFEFKTFFYQLPSFEVISKQDQNGPILANENLFYIYEDDGLAVFSQNGEFIDKKLTKYGKTEYACSGINFVDDNLLICLKNKRLCKL